MDLYNQNKVCDKGFLNKKFIGRYTYGWFVHRFRYYGGEDHYPTRKEQLDRAKKNKTWSNPYSEL